MNNENIRREQSVDSSAERVGLGEILGNIRTLLNSPNNIMMTASCFFFIMYEALCCVMVYNLAPANVPAFKAAILPTLFLAVLPTLYTRKMHANILPAAVVGFLTLTGVAFQACISTNYSGYNAINYLAIIAVLLSAAALKTWDTKLKDNRRLLTVLYWVCTGILLPICIVMRLTFDEINGAYCWLVIGSHSIQVTELLKLVYAFTIIITVHAAKKDSEIMWKTFLTAALMSAGMACVNEGGTIVVCVFALLIVQFFCITDEKTLKKTFGIDLLCACAAITMLLIARSCFADRDGLLGTLYDLSKKAYGRFAPFLPFLSDDADTYQVDMAKNAFRLGKLFGSSSTYIHSLPEYDSDFVFCAVASRFGILIATFLILAFVYLFIHAVRVYRQSDSGTILIVSTALLSAQAMIVFLGNLNIAPVIGVTLPMISSGGTSIVASEVLLTASLICMGKSNAVELRKGEPSA